METRFRIHYFGLISKRRHYFFPWHYLLHTHFVGAQAVFSNGIPSMHANVMPPLLFPQIKLGCTQTESTPNMSSWLCRHPTLSRISLFTSLGPHLREPRRRTVSELWQHHLLFSVFFKYFNHSAYQWEDVLLFQVWALLFLCHSSLLLKNLGHHSSPLYALSNTKCPFIWFHLSLKLLL